MLAGWLLTQAMLTPPPEAQIQVASVEAATAVLEPYAYIFKLGALLTGSCAAVGGGLMLLFMLLRRHPDIQSALRRFFLVCQAGLLLTGGLLAGILFYFSLQGMPEALTPVSPFISTYWTHTLGIYQYGGITCGGLLMLLAAACMLIHYLRFSEKLREWRRSMRRW